MRKFTARDGTLRIFDGAERIAKGAQANMSVYVWDQSGPTFTDKTAEAYADDTSYTGNFWVDSPDKIYVGQTTPFARIKYLQGGGVDAIAAGALVPKYYNGTSFTGIPGFEAAHDGTAVSGNTLAQDGYIHFNPPYNWAKGGDASLDSTMYYIELAPTSYPTTEPSADILAPVDGQFRDVIFANMDFAGPFGRALTEEQLVLNRGQMDSYGHYVQGSDDPVHAPLPISFSFLLDDTVNLDYIFDALICANPNDGANWTASGTTTKGDTKNDGTNSNPAFANSSEKTVDIQMLWATGTTGGYDQGVSYYEVYFPREQQQIAESDEGVIMTCNGLVYGVIENIHWLADRY